MPNKIKIWFESERTRWPLWLPVLFAMGVGLYFMLPNESSPVAALLWSSLWPLCYQLHTRRSPFVLACVAAAVIGAGFSMALLNTSQIIANPLHKPIKMASMQGQVIEISDMEKGHRLTLDHVTVEGMDQAQTPQRVRVSYRGKSMSVITGDWVKVRASLMSPSGAVLPNGFDFARFFFFQRIGGVGYVIPPIEVIASPAHNEHDVMIEVNRVRTSIANRMRDQMDKTQGSVAVALTTGDMVSIPKWVNQDMRATNLTHILSISGMHMAIITGIVFIGMRIVLVLLPFTRHLRSIKKWAAGAALLVALMYLYLSGLQVAAIRSFVMTGVLLVSVLLDREAMPMRSIAWAALCLLVVNPANILDVSFQLSFAATLALISFFEGIRDRANTPRVAHSYFKRLWLYAGGIILTSVVAEAATLPIILYHFHNVSAYGLLANLLVAPLVSFVIMPAILLALCLMPLGVESWALDIAGWGIGLMLEVAHKLAALPYARMMIPGMPDWGLYLMVLGGLWLCLWRKPMRYAGLGLMAIGALSWLTISLPDVLISPDGKQVAARMGDTYVMMQGRPKGFMPDQWAAALGQVTMGKVPEDSNQFRCDVMGCIAKLRGHSIAIAKELDALREDCERADVLIAPYYFSKADCKHPAVIIDKRALSHCGAHWLWVQGDSIKMRAACEEQGQRPWSVYQAVALPQPAQEVQESEPVSDPSPVDPSSTR